MSAKDYARRPELKTNEDSYVKWIKRPTFEALNRIAERAHSEFKKPYTDDFWPMELWADYPWPQFHPFLPTPNFPEPVPEEPWGPGTPVVSKVCMPMCIKHPHEIAPGESEWVKFSGHCPSIFRVTATLTGPAADDFTIGEIRQFEDDDDQNIWGAYVTADAGADGWAYVTFQIHWYGFSVGPEGRVEDPNDIHITILDCQITSDCCPSGNFAFDDDSTADTIDQEDEIEIYVTGGCPPFSWSVSGTGFSMANATTTARQNTLESDNTACGPAHITITDKCGDTANAYIRCTAISEWVLKSEGSCVVSGTGTSGGSPPAHTWYYYLDSGYQKQTQTTFRSWGGTCWFDTEAECVAWCPDQNDADCGEGAPANCIDQDHEFPGHCWTDEPACPALWNGNCYCVKQLAYYEWECS